MTDLTVLPPMPATAEPIILPGLLRGLRLTDYAQALTDGLTETDEAFDTRLSRQEAQ